MLMKTITALFASLSLCCILAGCTAKGDTPPATAANTQLQAQNDATKAALAQPVAPPAPAANPYPNGMAQVFSDCGKPGFNSNNGLCNPIGGPVAAANPPPKATPSLDDLNDQLSKLGMLDASGVNAQGYPIINVECEPNGQCVNGTGTPIGTVAQVAAQMPPIRADDILTYNYRCTEICMDDKANIVGRVPDSVK
jgi:hypothetical protein